MSEEPVKYIRKVEIQGLWGRYDIVWDLHPDVNVLAGINGSGKSTILNLLSFKSSEFKVTGSLKLTFNNNKTFLEKPQKPQKSQTKVFSDGAVDFNLSILLLPYDVSFINTFDAEAKSHELLEKFDTQVKTELDFELWKLQKEYLNYQVNLGKKLKANKGNIEDNSTYFHDKFLEIVDNLFSETGKKVNRDKNELEFLLGDKEINAYQLSSGEKQLLIILLTVLVQDNKPAILLMDEPEISLHMKWQRNLISYIRELNPNVQLIIATHSPDIIMDGWMDKVFNMCDIAKDSQ